MAGLLALAILAGGVAALWLPRSRLLSGFALGSDLRGGLKFRVKEVCRPSAERAGRIWLLNVQITSRETAPVELHVEAGWRFRDGTEVTRAAGPEQGVSLAPLAVHVAPEMQFTFGKDDGPDIGDGASFRTAAAFLRIRDRLTGRRFQVELAIDR